MSWPKELPEGSHLAYTCLHEIRLSDSKPEISGLRIHARERRRLPSDAEFEAAAATVEAAEVFSAAAERTRLIQVARTMGATYPVTLTPPPGSEQPTRRADFPFADYLEDVLVERQGETTEARLDGAGCPSPAQPDGIEYSYLAQLARDVVQASRMALYGPKHGEQIEETPDAD